MKGLKNRHLIPQLGQISRTGQAGRTGTYHRYLLSVSAPRTCRDNSVLPGPVRHKTLQFSDGYRIPLDSTDTFSLTLAFLRAHTAAYRRKGGSLCNHLRSLLKRSFLYLFHKCRDVDGHRTAADAFCILAVQASGGLRHGFLLVMPKAHLFKVFRSLFWVLFPHRNLL